MLIDFNTGKEIPSDPILTTTQSLVKSSEIINRDIIDFEDKDNNDWNVVLQANEVLTPKVIIDQFQGVLTALLEGKSIDPDYAQYMIKQCQDWEVSDQFTIVE